MADAIKPTASDNADAAAIDTGHNAPTVIELPTISITSTATKPNKPSKIVSQTVALSSTDTPQPDLTLQSLPADNETIPDAWDLAAAIFVNGASIGPPSRFEVNVNGYYQSDKYYVEIPLGALPTAYNAAFWSNEEDENKPKEIEIRVGRNGSASKSLIIGKCDDIEIQWERELLLLRGRDLSAALMDTKTAEKFTNMTSSQVAIQIATKHNLQAQVSQTTALIGTFNKREHVHIGKDISEHDLLTFLAEQEGFNYWIEGRTLYFKVADQFSGNPFVVQYTPATADQYASGNFVKLSTKRSETLAKDIKVTVISWDAKHKHLVKKTSAVTRARTGSKLTSQANTTSSAPQQGYVFRFQGLTEQQAQDRANSLAKMISRFERSIDFEMPLDLKLSPRGKISLRGTGTGWDQAYYVESIDYVASHDDGARMEVRARNFSPQQQVVG